MAKKTKTALAKAPAHKSDGAKAFELASEMYNHLIAIENLMHALHWIAENADEPRESGALYALANGIQDHLEMVEKMRGQISNCTHAYRMAAVV
jgi:hypothetical protein